MFKTAGLTWSAFGATGSLRLDRDSGLKPLFREGVLKQEACWETYGILFLLERVMSVLGQSSLAHVVRILAVVNQPRLPGSHMNYASLFKHLIEK